MISAVHPLLPHRAYTLRSDQLRPGDQATTSSADGRATEAAGDRARRRFGPDAIHPATLANPQTPAPDE